MSSVTTKTCPSQFQQSGNMCNHYLKADIQCHLGSPSEKVYNKSKSLIQPCYNTDGTLNPSTKNNVTPSAPSSSTKPSQQSLNKTCSALLPFGDGSTNSSGSTLLVDIKTLQGQEQSLLQKLQTAAGRGSGSVNEHKIAQIVARLKPIQDARVRLMKQLQTVASQTQCSLSGDRRALQDQVAMLMIAEDQLKTVEKQTEDLINTRNNKHRMVQITNYEYNRFSSHASIFKTIAFCSLFILGGVYLNGLGWTMLGNAIIVISIAVAIFLTAKRIWWNYWRSPMNWRQFEWDVSHPRSGRYETVLEHDEHAFKKGWNAAKDEASDIAHKAENVYDKAKKDVKKAYHSVSNDIQKDTTHQSTGHGKAKGAKASESFAPFN